MNGKRARVLRKEAQMQTIGQTNRLLVAVVRPHSPNRVAVNAPSSTRGVYRKLKRQNGEPGL